MELATLVEYGRQADVPQLAHLAAAALGFHLGSKASSRDRLILWGACAGLFLGLGWLGFRFGTPELPTSYRAPGPELYVFRPVPGLIELRAVDHVLHYAMGCLFAASAAAALWADGTLARAATWARRRPEALDLQGGVS